MSLHRLSSNVGWYVMWVQATEIIPTSVRGTGTNVAGLVAAASTFAVPYVTVIVSIFSFPDLNNFQRNPNFMLLKIDRVVEFLWNIFCFCFETRTLIDTESARKEKEILCKVSLEKNRLKLLKL